MTQNTSKSAARALTTILALTVVLLPASSLAAEASTSHPGIVGTWTVQVTIRDCTTNAPLGPPFNSLVTFHGDGTLSEAAGSLAFAPGQRSPGHGVWSPKRRHTFKQEMVNLILFDTPPNLPFSPGFFAGWQTVTHTVRLTGADEIESEGTNAFYRANGELYRSGCSTATGQRF
jgi:hypothetical protein